MRLNEEQVTFSIYCTTKPDDEKATCHRVESIGSHVGDTQLGLPPEVSSIARVISPKEDGLEPNNEKQTYNSITQEALHKESNLSHDKGGWVQQVRKPPKSRLLERAWRPKEKKKGGTPGTFIIRPKLEAVPPHST